MVYDLHSSDTIFKARSTLSMSTSPMFLCVSERNLCQRIFSIENKSGLFLLGLNRSPMVLKGSLLLGSYILRNRWKTGGHEEGLKMRSLGSIPEITKGMRIFMFEERRLPTQLTSLNGLWTTLWKRN